MATSKLGESTQAIVNAFPPWSKTRQDDQSNNFQYLNVVGRLQDDLHKQVITVGKNYFLSTASVADLDILHAVVLPETFKFSILEDEDGIEVPQEPTISGIIGNTSYNVATLNTNTVETLWYKTLPSRFSLCTLTSGNHLLLTQQVGHAPFIYSGSSFTNSGVSHIQDGNRLSITILSGNNMLGITQGEPTRGLVNITGISHGQDQETETVVFLYNQTRQTVKEWQQVKKINVWGIEPYSSGVEVRSGRFNHGPYKDFWNIEANKDTKQNLDIFWDTENYTPTGTGGPYPVLSKIIYEVDEFAKLLEGFTNTQVIRRVELLDASGVTANPIKDMTLQPFFDRVWVLTNDKKIHVYDKSISIPSTRNLITKNTDASIVLEPDTNYLIRGDILSLSYFWQRPTKEMIRHKVHVEYPDGTKYLIVDGAMTPYTTDGGWKYASPRDRRIRATDTFTLTTAGEYVYTIEAQFDDKTREVDQRIILVDTKKAEATYDIASIDPLLSSIPITGIDFDSNNRLWLFDGVNGYYYICPHIDAALIDYTAKVLYFVEPYDQVRVYP
jgi:hypothetical protein